MVPAHVPVRSRCWFVGVCVLFALVVSGLFWAACYKWDWVPGDSLRRWWGGITMALVLAQIRISEGRLRRKFLPPQGQTHWCFRAGLAVCLIGFGLSRCLPLLWPYAYQVLPPTEARDGVIGIWVLDQRGEETPDKTFEVAFHERCRSPGYFPKGPGDDSLRFYLRDHPERGSWMIGERNGTLSRGKGSANHPWNGEGLAAVFEDLIGPVFTPEQKVMLATALDDPCTNWRTNYPLQQNSHRPGNPRIRVRGEMARFEPSPVRWIPLVFQGAMLLCFSVAIYVSARLTLGRPA